MLFYLELQLRRLYRKINGWGIHPIVALLVGLPIFVVLSEVLFFKFARAGIIYLAIALYFLFHLQNKDDIAFLKQHFSRNTFHLLRAAENGMIILPFALFLLYKGEWIGTIVLVLGALILSWVSLQVNAVIAIPTPFKRRPWELIMGFRRSVGLLLLPYYLCGQAIWVDNFNLGLFSIILIFLMVSSFFYFIETPYFIWIYNKGIPQFLFSKCKDALWGTAILSLPLLMALFVSFPENALWIIGGCIIGSLFIVLIIMGKYSAYPHEMNLPQALLMIVAMLVPLAAIFVIPILYRMCHKRLQNYLVW